MRQQYLNTQRYAYLFIKLQLQSIRINYNCLCTLFSHYEKESKHMKLEFTMNSGLKMLENRKRRISRHTKLYFVSHKVNILPGPDGLVAILCSVFSVQHKTTIHTIYVWQVSYGSVLHLGNCTRTKYSRERVFLRRQINRRRCFYTPNILRNSQQYQMVWRIFFVFTLIYKKKEKVNFDCGSLSQCFKNVYTNDDKAVSMLLFIFCSIGF